MIELRILMLEDNPTEAGLNERVLRQAGLVFIALCVDSEHAFKRSLEEFKPDIVLSDYNLPSYNGRAALEYVQKNFPDLPVIMVTGAIGEEMAVELLKAGARDYILKDRLTRLPAAILRVIEEQKELSARRESEKKLREAESKFRILFETANDGIFLHDTTGIVDCNQEAASMYGMTKGDIIGRRTAELCPERQPDGRQSSKVIAEKKYAAMGGESQNFELQALRADNTIFDVDISLNRIELDGIVYLQSIVRDITERKKLEDDLRIREQYQRALLDNFPFMVWLKDTDSRLLAVNRAYLETAGLYSGTCYFGKTDLDMFPAEQAEIYRADDFEVMRTGQKKTVEELIGAPGMLRWHETYKAPVLDADGKLLGTVGFARDITERKRIEDLLHAREQEFRAMVENSPDVVVRYDTHCRRVYVNPAMQRQFGLSIEEILGKTPLESSTMAEAAAYMQQIQEVLKSAQESQMEFPFHDIQGGEHWGHMRLVPEFNKDGEVVSVLTKTRDITDRKRAEEELKKRERDLEESRAQLRGLTARREEVREEERKHIAREVHDELGQILTGLKLNISIIEHKYAAESASLREHLQETLMLIDRSLEVARNVASALRPAVLDLGIVSALEWLAGRFELSTGIQCEMIISETEIRLDENHEIALFRIVQESLTNVARHAKAQRVDIAIAKDADDYVLKVRDNGTGFDTNAKQMNSFGLVGIRERALMLGGTIAINSRPGNGTEIEVRIPAQSISEES